MVVGLGSAAVRGLGWAAVADLGLEVAAKDLAAGWVAGWVVVARGRWCSPQ